MAKKHTSPDMRKKMFGVDVEIPFIPGKKKPVGIPINFDNAATTPSFLSVFTAIAEKMNTYGAIGRSYGAKSAISSRYYEECRETILKFFGAYAEKKKEQKYGVAYVTGATDGLNRLARMLCHNKDDVVITTRMEHHANDLPWRNLATVLHTETESHGVLDMYELKHLLRENAGRVRVVSVAAASNVTGHVNDVLAIAGLAHKYGAKIVVDGAQIAAHKPFSMFGKTEAEDIDYFTFSAHKLYAPFGAGAIIGVMDELEILQPALHGGGSVALVADESLRLLSPPDRHESGSPNYFGIVAMEQAMREIMSPEIGGFDYIVEHEVALLEKTVEAMRAMPEIQMYNFCSDPACKLCAKDTFHEKRVGVIAFNVRGMPSGHVAQQLSEKGVAIREGAFCAHPYVARLMNVSDEAMLRAGGPPRMLRISFGIYNTEKEVDAFLEILRGIVSPPMDGSASFGATGESDAWAMPVKDTARGAS